MLKKTFLQPETLAYIHAIGASHDKAYETRPLLLEGNTKTGKMGKHGYLKVTRGIPVHDCPNASEACSKECYALKYICWNIGRNFDMGEYYSYLAHTNPKKLHAILRRDTLIVKAYPVKVVVRVHDAGDFVSVRHVQVYEKLAKEFPEVIWYGYTHSKMDGPIGRAILKASRLPNFQFRESTDTSRPDASGLLPVAHYEPTPTREAMKAKYPGGYFFCPEQLGGPGCADCGLCWNAKMDHLAVVFKKH